MATELCVAPITIPEHAWESFDDGDHLVAAISINGTNMHLEALAVVTQRAGHDIPVNTSLVSDKYERAILDIIAEENSVVHTTIRGREYVLVATPFAY